MALQPVEFRIGNNIYGAIVDTSTDWMLGPTFPSQDAANAFLDYHKGGRRLRLLNDNDLEKERDTFISPIRCENEPCEHDKHAGYVGGIKHYRVKLGEYEPTLVMALCDDCRKALNARYFVSIAKEESDAKADIDDGDYSDSYIDIEGIEE